MRLDQNISAIITKLQEIIEAICVKIRAKITLEEIH